MDDLEFRRKMMADPENKDPQINQQLKSDPASLEFATQMRKLNSKISSAIKVDVPDGLADRLILKQSFVNESSQLVKRHRWHLAMAASIAFFIGLTFSHINIGELLTPTIGSVALAHVHHEMPFTQEINETATLKTINSKLVRYGLNLNQTFEHVYYVNHCNYHNEPALHMIVQGKVGKVTLFVVPEDQNLRASPVFSDHQMKGEVFKLKNASLVLVGDKNEPLEQFGHELTAKFEAI